MIGSGAGYTITELDKGDITENGNIATYNQLSLDRDSRKGKFLQQLVWGPLDIHMQKKEMRPRSLPMYKIS